MKYLIYKISGGLNHMLLQINNAIKLSRISNRFLIIDCKAGAFDSDFSSYFEIDDFNYSTNYDIIYDEMKENLVEIEPYIKGHTDYINGQYFLLDKLVSINSQNVIESKEKIV